jgi:hypothetical protein
MKVPKFSSINLPGNNSRTLINYWQLFLTGKGLN